MRVFLDANVIFSASNSTSAIAQLIALLADKGVLVTSDAALLEAQKNLFLKRPQWMAAYSHLSARLVKVPTVNAVIPVALDAKDAPLLASAIHAGCDYFVTGDKKDFAHLYNQRPGGVEIITVRELAERAAALLQC